MIPYIFYDKFLHRAAVRPNMMSRQQAELAIRWNQEFLVWFISESVSGGQLLPLHYLWLLSWHFTSLPSVLSDQDSV